MLGVGACLFGVLLESGGGGLLLLLLLDLGPGDAVGCEEGDEFLFCEGEAERAEGDAEFVVV